MLTLQNHVSLSNLTTFRSLNAGALTARAWETLRAAVAGVALPRPWRLSEECRPALPPSRHGPIKTYRVCVAAPSAASAED